MSHYKPCFCLGKVRFNRNMHFLKFKPFVFATQHLLWFSNLLWFLWFIPIFLFGFMNWINLWLLFWFVVFFSSCDSIEIWSWRQLSYKFIENCCQFISAFCSTLAFEMDTMLYLLCRLPISERLFRFVMGANVLIVKLFGTALGFKL